jgi:cytochrome d ubiquinol oxidase subunit I
MDALFLARLQFALITVYHFFFVPLTLGLSILVALMETFYVRTGQDIYKRMTKFWGKLFLINFAVGVVTGIVQEFQFGMNWSEYSRYVGDVFGAPLAIEALLAFFLESTFIGIWIFGWDKLSKWMHAATIWLVAIGANISALWILIANSWMQQPVGYIIAGDRAVMVDFFEVIFNPNIWYQFPHVFLSGLVTMGFFVMGICAYHLIRKQEMEFFKKSFQLAAMFAVFGIVGLGLNGHSQAQHVAQVQPMKIAATEALWETEDPASFSLFTIGSLDGREEVFSVRIPGVLSLLSFNSLEGEVRGMNELQAEFEAKHGPGNYIPPAFITYWSFRFMVGAGLLMVLLAFYGLFLATTDLFEHRIKVLRLFILAIALPYIANSAGWLLTEVGRFPWVVYDLVTLAEGVSNMVTASMVWLSLIGYTLIYSFLIVVTIYLMRKYAQAGPVSTDTASPLSDDIPSLAGALD